MKTPSPTFVQKLSSALSGLKACCLILAGLMLIGLTSTSHAATYTWSTNLTGVGGGACMDGGALQWNTASNRWMLTCGVGVPGPWINGSDAIFGAGSASLAGTVTLGGAPNVKNLTNNAAGGTSDYTLTASTLRITGTPANPSVFFISSGRNFNVGNNSGSLSVADAAAPNTLQKEGTGVLHLLQNPSGSVKNTYTGGTIMNAGGLTINQTNNLGPGKFTFNGGRFSSFNNSPVGITNTLDLGGDVTVGHVSASGAVSFNGPNAFTIKSSTRSVTINSASSINQVIGNDTSGAGLTKAGNSNLTLTAVNTYDGPTTISAGTLILGASAGFASGSSVSITAGARLDVSALTTWTLGSGATLTANGTGTNVGTLASAIKGGTTVDLGTRPISLTFTPTAFAGDTTHPSLYIETGTLSLSGNAFTVNNAAATPLGIGTYRIAQQPVGSVTSSGSHTVSVTGTGLAPSTAASIIVSGGNVNLLVASAVPATKIQPETAADGSGTLVPAQTVNSGNSITVYAIARAADNSFVGNIAATWSTENETGGVVDANLVPSGDTKSAVFTGNVSGTANIRCTSGILTATDSGTITVACGTATTTNPSDQIATTGNTATFTISAGSSSSPTYQWQTNGVNIGGANSAGYTTPATTVAMNLLQYRCIVSVACDSSSATSTVAILYVADPSNTSFRSAASGAWATPVTWQMSPNNGANWFTATVAPSDANSTNILVQSGHNVTSSGTASADDLLVVGKVTVSGGAFTVANGAAAVDASVIGAVESSGGTITSSGALRFESGGYYAWIGNAGPIVPTATWADGSLCAISNTLSSATSGSSGVSGQSYYDFTVGYPAGVARRTFLGITGTGTVIRRNFNITIADLATASVAICTNTGTILTVSNINFSAGTGTTSCKVLFNSTAASTATIAISGNVIATGTVDAFGPATLQFNSGIHPLSLPTGGNYVNSASVSYTVDAGSIVTASNALGSSAVLTLNGSLTLNGGAGTFAGPNTVGSAGVFRINFNGGTVPTATWPAGSRVEVTGTTSTSPTAGSLSQPLHDFTWDNAGQTGNIGMGGPSITNTGTFHVKNTAGFEVRLSNGQSQPIIANDVRVQAGTLVLASGAGSPTLNAAGHITIDTGATLKASGGTGVPAINLTGNLTNNGTLNLALNRTNTPNATKLTGLPAVNQNGTLTISNNGPAPVNGDTFDLFDGAITGSFSTVNLPAGGAAHWNTSDLNVGGTVVFTNANPSANVFSLGVAVGGSATAQVMGKYATSPDVDGDTVTITSVSTPSLGTAAIVGGTNITYTSTGGPGSDSFTYTVSDGIGGTDTKTVSVTISSPEGFNKLSGPTGAGPYSFSYLGIPGQNYSLDESPNLVAPYTWFPVTTNTAAGNGAIDYIGVPLSYPSGSFRTRHVP